MVASWSCHPGLGTVHLCKDQAVVVTRYHLNCVVGKLEHLGLFAMNNTAGFDGLLHRIGVMRDQVETASDANNNAVKIATNSSGLRCVWNETSRGCWLNTYFYICNGQNLKSDFDWTCTAPDQFPRRACVCLGF